uniref:RING-type E3 ubiquitin transferase n=1 Tax=Nicotiana sylvestris TaxID=4096 RepID=A0A1U7W3F2_NICSY|nr:PREDICTED: U-box domain-containing protein 35 isoform X2 [Nicotiana sylvestris]
MVSPQGLHEERLVAVGIDKNKGSQYALRWATENVLAKGQKVTLLHVPSTPPSPTSFHNGIGGNDLSIGQDPNNQCTDLFLPFRVFCSFKEVAYDLITLEGHDIAKALIDYVSLYRVQNLVLGCPSKNGISRLFTKSDVANIVLKKAPSFCNIYIVSKGKISSARLASHPLKKRSSVPSIQIPLRNSNFDATSFMSPFPRLSTSTNKIADELNVPKAEHSFPGSDRLSTDSVFLDCYDNLGCEFQPRRPSKSLNFIDSKSGDHPTRFIGSKFSGFSPTRLVDHLDSAYDLLLSEQKCEENSLSSDKIKEMEEKMRRLELQTIQTMEMYHAACKEALREKQKVKELENLRKEDEKKLVEARRQKEEALACVAKEEALRMASKEEAKAAQKKAEREAQRRKRSERKAQKKSEAKKTALKSLVHSQKAIKYQSLLRILVVLIIFYVYFFELR